MFVTSKSIFLSDVHLFDHRTRIDKLLYFLKEQDIPQKLYLVGDFLDLWLAEANPYLEVEYSDLVQYIAELVSWGTQVIWILGNHEDSLWKMNPILINGKAQFLLHEAVHTTLGGSKYLVTHGHKYDAKMRHPWMAKLLAGAVQYIGSVENWITGHWSLNDWLHSIADKAVHEKQSEKFINHAIKDVKKQGYDGIICGHTHIPMADYSRGYYNCGDWIDSYTAIVEDENGSLNLEV